MGQATVNERGEVRVDWQSPFAAKTWEKLHALGRQANNDDDAVMLGLLPDERDNDQRLVVLLVHRHVEKDQLHWLLMVDPRPKDPSQELLDDSKKLGGRSALLALLTESLPANGPSVGTFHIRLRLPRAAYRHPSLPIYVARGSENERVLALSKEAYLEQVGYRLVGGAGGIAEVAIIYLHRVPEYSVYIEAEGPLKLASPTWLPYADDIIDLVKSTFFIPSEAADEA